MAITDAIVISSSPLQLKASINTTLPQQHATMASPSQSPADIGNLLGHYKCAQFSTSVTEKSDIRRDSTGEAFTKKRKVELVASKICPPPKLTKSKKSKSPKKKPQTVTAKATAPFLVADPVNNLLQYLTPDSAPGPPFLHDDQQPVEKRKRKSTTKSISKAKAAKTKTAKVSRKTPILLPPEKALENTMDQDLLFGTSSQLARDESPTFARQLQQAIEESELTITDDLRAINEGSKASVASRSTDGSSLALFTASRSLWSAASRDLNGSVQEAEVVDLSKTPRPPPPSRIPALPSAEQVSLEQKKNLGKASKPCETNDEWTNLDDISSPDQQQCDNEIERSVPKSLAEAALKHRPKSRSPVKKSRLAGHVRKPPAHGASIDMPNYRGFTTADLNKELKAYHFKPIKKREDQIALLERCWESRNRIALQSLEPNASIPQPRSEQPSAVNPAINPLKNDSPTKKKRGRPPKSAKVVHVQMDSDIAGEVSSPAKLRESPKKDSIKKKKTSKKLANPPKEPRASKQATTKHPPPAQPLNIPDADAEPDPDTTPRPTSKQLLPSISPPPSTILNLPSSSTSAPPTPLTHTHLLTKITQAITTYPPTHDMHNLTPYEKILLYDPIVLEDLAAWLNTEALGRVGVDQEVSAALVKEWCEGQSVCCLWRENSRGRARKR